MIINKKLGLCRNEKGPRMRAFTIEKSEILCGHPNIIKETFEKLCTIGVS